MRKRENGAGEGAWRQRRSEGRLPEKGHLREALKKDRRKAHGELREDCS